MVGVHLSPSESVLCCGGAVRLVTTSLHTHSFNSLSQKHVSNHHTGYKPACGFRADTDAGERLGGLVCTDLGPGADWRFITVCIYYLRKQSAGCWSADSFEGLWSRNGMMRLWRWNTHHSSNVLTLWETECPRQIFVFYFFMDFFFFEELSCCIQPNCAFVIYKSFVRKRKMGEKTVKTKKPTTTVFPIWVSSIVYFPILSTESPTLLYRVVSGVCTQWENVFSSYIFVLINWRLFQFKLCFKQKVFKLTVDTVLGKQRQWVI